MKFLFVLGTEQYTGEQIRRVTEVAEKGGYTEIFVPTPDGSSKLSGNITYMLRATTFRCGTMIVPAGILAKIRENYRLAYKDIHLTFCDLIDTWRCEVNRVSAKDAGFHSEVLKMGNRIRRTLPAYEYPMVNK